MLISQGKDEFYIFRLKDLQEIIFKVHCQYLEKHMGRRPRNPDSTHISVNPELLERFKNNWKLISNYT
jgi:hypothetical protein